MSDLYYYTYIYCQDGDVYICQYDGETVLMAQHLKDLLPLLYIQCRGEHGPNAKVVLTRVIAMVLEDET